MEHRIVILGRITAAVCSLLNFKPPYGFQKRWSSAVESTKSTAEQSRSARGTEADPAPGVYAQPAVAGVQSLRDGEHLHLLGGVCPEPVSDTPVRTGVPKKTIGKNR